MEYSLLGSSQLKVSRACLGTMTWGVQNNQADADAQIERALELGVNFIDTAEMYATPPTPDTFGATETIIGNWLARNSAKRQDFILNSKISGPGLPWVRGGQPVTGKTVIEAVDDSLARLQTDYIDLYQIHWPNRPNSQFANHWPNGVKTTAIDKAKESEGIIDILRGVQHCIDAGKIRHLGLSDDSPWGVSEYIRLATEYNLPRPVSIQNEFSLLHSKDWPYLIEYCVMEDVAYLPWSPMATGILSGKYIDGQRPTGSRWTITQRKGLFRNTDSVNSATKAYLDVAQSHNISLASLALAWCNQVDGVTSSIIGATSLEQLEENIAAFSVKLSPELVSDIQAVLKQYPSPY